jgi:HEAT repeat protein
MADAPVNFGFSARVSAAGRGDSRTLLEMLEALPREKRGAREDILSSLLLLRPPEAVPVARAIATDAREGPLVRAAAIELLGRIGDRSVIPDVLRLLADGPPRVRVEAADILGELGGEATETALMEALSDEHRDARAAASRSLGMLRSTNAIPFLAERLERDPKLYVRQSAALALHQIANDAAHEALDRGIEHLGPVTRWRVRRWVETMQ